MDKMQAIEILLSERFCASNTTGAREKLQAYDMALDSLKGIRPKGKWETVETCIDYIDNGNDLKCSNCGSVIFYMKYEKGKYKYCPYCGAEMEVE